MLEKLRIVINGSLVDVGETKDCYFSPDGITKRTNGLAQNGDFGSFNETSINRIARLNSDGTLDNTFTVGTGLNNRAYDIKVDSTGKILLGGIFITYNGVSKGRIAKLKSDGTLDTTFSANLGNYNTTYTLDVVYDISVTADNKILLGGKFKRYNSDAYSNIIVLNMDGTSDTLNNYNL